MIGSSEIYVLQRSKPDVLVISNVYGKTLQLSLLKVNEFWLYGYKLQEFQRLDKWLTVQDISAQGKLQWDYSV